MKTALFLLLVLLSGSSFGQNKTVVLNGSTFEFREIHADSVVQRFVEVYRDNQKLLTHVLSGDDGDCSSSQIELGGYEITGNQLVFYTYWAAADRQSLLTYPFGARKQVYQVLPAGTLKLTTSGIYIEDYVEGIEKRGIDYLRQSSPRSKSQTEVLNKYITHIEKAYNAKFVTGKEKQLLLQEVRKKLSREIREETRNWKEIYGSNIRM